MSIDGQGTLWRRNIAKNFNRLGRVHQRYRQTTDGRTTTYSEREREFTFAKNKNMMQLQLGLHCYSMWSSRVCELICLFVIQSVLIVAQCVLHK